MARAVHSAYSVEGEGPALFLIHGIGASRASFAGLVPHLKKEFRCISYDLRGHGLSPKPQPPYTLQDLVEDLEALRAELGIEKAQFAGHSLGGMVGPAYARNYTQHLISLGLYSTAAFRTDDDSAKVKGVVAAIAGLAGRMATQQHQCQPDGPSIRGAQNLRKRISARGFGLSRKQVHLLAGSQVAHS